jgi:hypothetical protein
VLRAGLLGKGTGGRLSSDFILLSMKETPWRGGGFDYGCSEFGSLESDSQHFKGLRRGVLRAFWDLKAENGVCFFGQKSFSTQFSLFS